MKRLRVSPAGLSRNISHAVWWQKLCFFRWSHRPRSSDPTSRFLEAYRKPPTTHSAVFSFFDLLNSASSVTGLVRTNQTLGDDSAVPALKQWRASAMPVVTGDSRISPLAGHTCERNTPARSAVFRGVRLSAALRSRPPEGRTRSAGPAGTSGAERASMGRYGGLIGKLIGIARGASVHVLRAAAFKDRPPCQFAGAHYRCGGPPSARRVQSLPT